MAKVAAEVYDVFSILDRKAEVPCCGTVAFVGTDSFLREQATRFSTNQWKIDSASLDTQFGEDVSWVDVHDRLATRSLFDDAGHRTLLLKAADKFVSKYRDALEKWVTAADDRSTLVLHLDQLASNTRLYKLLNQHGAIVDCKIPTTKAFGSPPDDRAIGKWIVSWATQTHGLRLTSSQSNVLVERIGPIFGLLDCELAKLALFCNDKRSVSDEHVDELVGGWRTKTAWDVAEWIAEGQIAEALQEIDKLFAAGQNPIALMAQISWALRRFGMAANVFEQARNTTAPIKLYDALSGVGFFGPKISAAEKQLRRIGIARSRQILDWLVELDLKLKGTHSQDDRGRLAIEEFVVRFT